MDLLRRLALTPVLVGIHAAYLLTEQIASAATSSSSAQPSTSSRHSLRSPKHVAFSIVTSHGRHSASSRDPGAIRRNSLNTPESRKGKEKARVDRWTKEEGLVLETVREAVAWALQNEVDEISLWNEDGILEDILPGLLSILVPSPPTPPASGSCSPPRFLSLSKSNEQRDSIASNASSSELIETDDGHVTKIRETQSYTVWPDMEDMLRDMQMGDKLRMKPLSVHILPTCSSEDLLVNITRDLVTADTPLEAITIEHIDGLVRDFLHFQNDPELLIVHHTAGSSGIRINANGEAETYKSRTWRYRALSRLVPVQSSEIHGYPFWMLRITEIYDSQADKADRGGHGWAGALARWRGVEQRLGR